MPDTAITPTISEDIKGKQAQMPAYVSGSYVGDDTDYHALKVNAQGKGKLVYCVDNKTDQEVVALLYGSHSATADVGDDGVFEIDSSTLTVAATSKEYGISNDPFPHFIVRASSSVAGDSEDVLVYVNFSAF